MLVRIKFIFSILSLLFLKCSFDKNSSNMSLPEFKYNPNAIKLGIIIE